MLKTVLQIKNYQKLLLSLTILAACLPMRANAQIVIVVPSKSNIDSLSLKEVQRLFKGQRTKTKQLNPCQIVEFAPASDAFYNKLYGNSAYAIGKHWLRMIFSGERVLPPKSFSDIKKFIKFIEENENAIGFLPEEKFIHIKGSAIHAVVIDGRSYRHRKYALR